MNPVEVIQQLEAQGFILEPEGGRLAVTPIARLTQEQRELLQQTKPGILRELRRRQALKMLNDGPTMKRAYVVDSDPDDIMVLLALRGVATCDLAIPRDKWNPFVFLKFLEGRDQ